MRLNKNITESGTFLLMALQEECQLVVGRSAGSENRLIQFSELPGDSAVPVPDDYTNPGFYFLKERTFEEKRATVHLWGKIWRDSYRVPNVFALFDWDDRPEMKSIVDKYAPDAGQIHSTPLYPPCLTQHNTRREPWTKWLQNKTILIVHPFVDSIKANVPKLKEVWSDVRVLGAPYSCMPVSSANLKYVRAKLPVASPTTPWITALDELKLKISQSGYFDLALLGCGGFGMPLLAYIQKLPHKPSAIYVGGALQLYFGIYGSRWVTDPGYSAWTSLYSNAWTWPLESDVSFSTIGLVEGSSYVKKGQGENLTIAEK